MEHFNDNSGCSGLTKTEIFQNNSRKVQYDFAGAWATFVSKRENALSAGALKGDVNGYFNLQSLKYCQKIHQMVKKKAFIIT